MGVELIAMLLVLGSIVGVLAGLLGIGGGVIVVPSLLYILPYSGINPEVSMHIALATSLATVILTSGSSGWHHLKLGNVDFVVVKWLLPGVLAGGFAGSYIAELIPSQYLPKIFGVIVLLLALQMMHSVRFQKVRWTPGKVTSLVAGSLIGSVATLAGIGGGSLIVPYLNRYGTDIRRAVGSASVCASLIAISGMSGFILHGAGAENLPDYCIGYVYLPALISIAATSVLTTRIGANMASKLPTAALKKIFALFLLAVAVKMLFS